MRRQSSPVAPRSKVELSYHESLVRPWLVSHAQIKVEGLISQISNTINLFRGAGVSLGIIPMHARVVRMVHRHANIGQDHICHKGHSNNNRSPLSMLTGHYGEAPPQRRPTAHTRCPIPPCLTHETWWIESQYGFKWTIHSGNDDILDSIGCDSRMKYKND